MTYEIKKVHYSNVEAQFLAEKSSRVIHLPNGGGSARIRRRLYLLDPHCFWCDQETRWVHPSNGVLPYDAATIDHVISRIHRKSTDPCDVVLACSHCNHQRNKQEHLEMPRLEQLERSRRPPKEKKVEA